MNSLRLILSIAILLCAAVPAAAMDVDEAHWCRNGLFPSDNPDIAVTRVVAAPRAYFLDDGGMVEGCPQKREGCGHAYVLPGQEVLAGKNMGNFVCVYFPNKSGGSAGWMPVEALAPAPKPTANPPLQAWAGRWMDGDDEISITVSKGRLDADGTAIWNGGNGNIHEGAFGASATPQNGRVTFVEEECRVSARLVARYLIVTDNSNCGGMNVRFDGVYTLAKKR